MTRRLKVGVYDRHLTTLGGGEKHMGVLAEILSRRHDVELITYEPIEKSIVERRLNIDLSKVIMRYIPDVSNDFASDYTAGYDLFINASFMSALPSRAARSAYLTFFPASFSGYLNLQKKAAVILLGPIVKMIKRRAEFIWSAGFYSRGLDRVRPYRWTNGAGTVLFKRPSVGRKIRVCLDGRRPSGVASAHAEFKINGRMVRDAVDIPQKRSFVVDLLPPESTQEPLVLEIISDTFVPAGAGAADDGRRLGVRVVWVRQGGLLASALQRLADITPPRLVSYPKKLDFLGTYQLFMANSCYTQSWIKRLWGRESEVLYPPIDMPDHEPAGKENMILGVGRFFTGGHSKKQLELVQAFKTLCDDGLKGWELHLAGGIHQEHIGYVDRIKREAMGYPIILHLDAGRNELDRLYEKSSIFWHAAGYGVDKDKNPEMFEHFGMTTVEAMAYGAVPVVFAGGGQVEIISGEDCGYLWTSLDELKKITSGLINDKDLLGRVRVSAVKRSHDFNAAEFERRLWVILKPLLKAES